MTASVSNMPLHAIHNLSPGLVFQRFLDQTASLSISGPAQGQWFTQTQYAYGWAFRCAKGNNPDANIFEWYPPAIFSVCAGDLAINPVLAVRDKGDHADISLQMDAERGMGMLRVGNIEGSFPDDYSANFRAGLEIYVNNGRDYVKALTIRPDGSFEINGHRAFSGDVGGMRFINGLLVEEP